MFSPFIRLQNYFFFHILQYILSRDLVSVFALKSKIWLKSIVFFLLQMFKIISESNLLDLTFTT